MAWVALDFETASSLKLKQVGAWVYAEHPFTQIICLCWQDHTGATGTWLPSDPCDWFLRFRECNRFISFGDFERAIWHHIMVPEFGYPELPNERWHDVQAVAAMKQMPKNLESLSDVLALPIQKDMEGNALIKSLSKVDKHGRYPKITPAIISRVSEYCTTDTAGTVQAHCRLGWLPPMERRAWLFNQTVCQRGIRIDTDYITNAQFIVDSAKAPLIAEFKAITGLVPTQTAKFKEWLKSQGVDMPSLAKQIMAEALEEDECENEGIATEALQAPPHVMRSLKIRQVVGSSSLAKLETMKKCTGLDGRARGLLQYHGTGPGRSSGRLIQPQNFPRPTIENYKVEDLVNAINSRNVELLDKEFNGAIPAVVSGLRHALVSDRARVFISADYSGIQARLVLALAGQHDKTALMASGKDVYCDMAEAIFKRPINKKDDPEERAVGKNSVLGLGFSMGASKFQEKYARRHAISFCQNVVDTYRKEWAPKVPTLWYALEAAAVECVHTGRPQEAYGIVYMLEDQWLICRVPSGSKIWYFNPQPTVQAKFDDIKDGFSYQATKQGRWVTVNAFGGLLTENVIMRMEADIMRTAQDKLEANGFPVVLEVHDENLTEPLIANADEKAMFDIMLDVDGWVKELQVPIAVEGWTGERYRK